MAFTFGWSDDDAGNGGPVWGAVNARIGWFNASGVTGGDIETGFKQCYGLFMQIHKSSADSWAVVNEATSDITKPFTGTVTIVCTSGAIGKFLCFGA